MASTQTPWTSILLQDKPGLHEYSHALSSVEKYYTRLREAMQDRSIHDQLVLRPEQTHSRLLRSFEILREKKLPAPVSEEIFKTMVLHFINDNIFSPAQVTQLVGSALPIVTKRPSPFLRELAATLLANKTLFNHLVADEKTTAALKEWLLSKRNYLNLTLSRQVGDRLIDMCQSCSAEHGMQATAESWAQAQELIESIDLLIETSRQDELKHRKVENLPSLESMKVLGPNDKKSSSRKQAPESGFKISDETLGQMKHFNIVPPQSARGLTYAKDCLKDQIIPELLRSALESFPCRMCLDRLTNSSLTCALPSSTELLTERTTEPCSAQDLFGKRVGPWKVLLSGIAFATAKSLLSKGEYAGVDERLRDLASGQWRGKDLSRRVGSKTQRKLMRVPVLEAAASATVSILWQVDVGFYEELPWVQQQIVKVWQIVTSEEEMKTAIEQIILIQESYPSELVQLCSERPVQQSDGNWMPRRFGNVKGASSYGVKPIAYTKATPTLIDMSNKFYNVTEPFLKSLGTECGIEEFPFDLSPEELEIVTHFSTSTLILGRSGTGKTSCLLFKMLTKHKAKQLRLEEQQIRQLLLTRSSYLASKLQTYARSLIEAQAQNAPTEEDVDSDLEPTSFFALQDSHFPFVCTYDEFLGLLENTLRMADRKDFLKDICSDEGKRIDALGGNKPRVIDFNIFKTEYWGCLTGLAPASCSPELLFAEIMGVIKGCGVTAKRLKPLTGPEYVKKNAKASPAFPSEADRAKVFASYERYEKQKKLRKEIDELDRVSGILKSLRDNKVVAEQIRRCFQEIYVDEIQDLRCLDIVLLLGCLSDARGIHLAGDTAQCISKDSVFRFPEIKALFYEHYEVVANQLKQPSLARPVQFSLAKNYRSHQGILSFASWVMKMLWNGFPETIDKLDPEIGQIGGPKPMIFAGFDSWILSAKMIGVVKLNDKVADFGAEQVILVRDDVSKDKLQAQIGEIALVLTILESKGMEFDDVLVYDFFGSSGLASSYRCLHMLVRASRTHFDSQKHAALCSELKSLYVAVTRAKKQLWFMEPQVNSVDPVLQALSQSDNPDLAEVVRQTDADVAAKVKVLRAGGSVDPNRWLKRAENLLHRKGFAEALFCYKKANHLRGISHSQACLHEQEGRSHRAAGDIEAFTACYEKAIALFLEIDLISEAASCYEGLGQFDKVAEIWKGRGQYPKAASFYEKGKMFVEASECYHSCGQYESAIEVQHRGNRFDDLVVYASRNRQYLSEATLLRYSRLCNILLRQGRVSTHLRVTTINLLGSDEAKVAFFKEFEMWDQLRSLYKAKSRWYEVHELSVAVGDIPAAISTLVVRKLMPVIDKTALDTLFNYAMTEELYAHAGLLPSSSERKGLLKLVKPTKLASLADQWRAIFSSLDRLDDPDVPASTKDLSHGLLKNIFCLFVIAFHATAFDKKKAAHLPVDFISRVGKLLQDFSVEHDHSLNSLALVCGIFINPKQERQAMLLRWSPLISYAEKSLDGSSFEDLLSVANDFMKKKLTFAVAQLHHNAKELMKKEYPATCYSLLQRGHCQKAQTNDCRFGHERTTPESASAKLDCLVTIAEAFARLTPVYHQRLLNDFFNRTFLPWRRHWVQRLQDELSMVTSLEQSPVAMTTLSLKLQSDPEFATTASAFEDLLYYRMRREWDIVASLSASLELVQQAHVLGPHTASRFQRATVLHMERNMFSAGQSNHPFSVPNRALKAAGSIRSAIARCNLPVLKQSFRDFVQCLFEAPRSLGSFHAVVSIFEFTVSYILCVTNPGKGIVIPWSWALTHLPTIMQSPEKDHIFKDRELRIHLDLLLAIVNDFCEVLNLVDDAISESRLRGIGRPGMPPFMVKHRCVDLLTTVVLNLNYWPKQPVGYGEVATMILKTVRRHAPKAMIVEFSSPDRLQKSCIAEYASYNRKDELCVVALDNRVSAPLFLRSFTQSNARFVKLSEVLQISSVSKRPFSSDLGEDGHVSDYSGYELDRIINLQRRWLEVMKIIGKRRRGVQSRESQLIQRYHDSCTEFMKVSPASDWPAREKIRMRKVVFTDCIKITMAVECAQQSYRQLKDRWKQQLDNVQSAAKLEELSEIRGRIIPIDQQLEYMSEYWSPRGIQGGMKILTAEQFGSSALEGYRTLRSVQRDIEGLRSQVERIAKRPD
ncbi:hypothetical protein N7535_006129 [Penicillium sp. DV-2018c]|nr:hypothetical protein N7461_007789 [Penicillium sp. DV-2018c]KAJ5566823.1 hypothetical protein N7535_006129 [Penicillium sp. DV-2018c]